MLDEVSRYCLPSLHSLLYGNNALSDQDNDLIFKAVQRYIVRTNPASILRKSTSGRYRPVSYPDGPMTARYRFT